MGWDDPGATTGAETGVGYPSAPHGLDSDSRRHVEAAWSLSEDTLPPPKPTVSEPDPATQRAFEAIQRDKAIGAKLTSAADVQPTKTRWFWPGYIPFGKTTMIDGWPGQGKSTLTMYLASCASTGTPMYGMDLRRCAPMGVIILSAEDALDDTIVPRLVAHGADRERVFALDYVIPSHGQRHSFHFPEDIPTLAIAIQETGAGLVIIDPFMAYLSGDRDSYKDHDVRLAMHPMSDLARDTGVAIVMVRHLTKGNGSGPALSRGGGSMGIIGAARAGLVVTQDPDDPSGRTKILAVSKMNVGKPGDSLEFHLEPTIHDAAKIHWDGYSSHTAETAFGKREG